MNMMNLLRIWFDPSRRPLQGLLRANGARGFKWLRVHIDNLVRSFKKSVRPEGELCERLEGWTAPLWFETPLRAPHHEWILWLTKIKGSCLVPISEFAIVLAFLSSSYLMSWYFNYKPNTIKPAQTHAAQRVPLVTVMLVPAGDARNQGRSLEHQFESSSSMACVESLKAAIEKTYPEVRVIVSHKAGEIVQQYQIPTMANTLGVDLVFTINCYHEQGAKPELYVYQCSYGADFINKLSELNWYTVQSAYLFSKDTTHAWANIMVNKLNSDTCTSLFTIRGPFKMPFKPLIGIKVPAIGIEISLKQDDDWTSLVDPFVASLEPMVGPLIKQRTIVEVA